MTDDPRSRSSLRSPLESKSLVDHIVDRIVAAILSGELALGSKLREQTLAVSLGISRGPLREAIRQLEGRGLVQRVPNHGPRIISLSSADLNEIYTIREALEGIACRASTELMSDAELGRLEKLLDKQALEIQKQARPYALESDLDFHSRIIAGARNHRLSTMINDSLFDLLRIYRARSEAVSGRGLRAVEEHRAVVEAMMARDPDKAEKMMRQHIRHARENVVAEIERREADAAAAGQG